MLRNLIAIVVLSLFIVSCGNQTNKTGNQETDQPAEITMLAIADFDAEAGNYVGEVVQIEGTVDHVCKHGGKRMFVMDDDPEVRVKVVVNENMPSFEVELEGSDVVVSGIVDELRIDEDYLIEWEAELATAEEEGEHGEEEGEHGDEGEHSDEGEDHAGQHSGQGEKADQGEHRDAYDMIAEYRAQIAETEKGYIAFYSIICNEFKEKKSE